ncbi:MAG: helix-hairpin-helix domain-containing protein [Acidobacteriaceae bacterium]
MRRRTLSDLTLRLAATVGLCAALLWVASCNANGRPESDRQIQQQAQQATENAKRAADKAAADARVAAANAEREANDVARGVKAGLHNGKGGGVDLNSASRADLETLPGVTATTARRIEDNRPYGTPHDLVRKGVVSEAEFDRMSGNVVTR